MVRFYFTKAVILTSLLISSLALANKKVKVLSWWGYLTQHPEKIVEIENKCGAKLSVDEYYTTEDFVRRYAGSSKYDLLIFSDTIFDRIRGTLNSKSDSSSIISTKSEFVKQYHPDVRRHILQNKNRYGNNTLFFSLSVGAYLYNSKFLSIGSRDSIESILKQSKGKIITFPDDYAEISNVFGEIPTGQEFLSMSSGVKKVYITNSLGNVPSHKDFGFSYTWLGEALQASSVKSLPHLKVVVSESSQISKDLITILDNRSESICFYRELSGKKFLNWISKKYRYFSPYGYRDMRDKKFFDNMKNMSWLNISRYSYFDKVWEGTKKSVRGRRWE